MDGTEPSGAASDFRTGGASQGNERKSISFLDLNKSSSGGSDFRTGGIEASSGGGSGGGGGGGVDFRTGGAGGSDFRTGGAGGSDFRTGGAGGSDFRTGGAGDSDFRAGGGGGGGSSGARRSVGSFGGNVQFNTRLSDSPSGRYDPSSAVGRSRAKTFAMPKPKIKIARNQIKLKDYQIEELGKAFDLFDEDGEGKMNTKDIKTVIRACGFEPAKDEIKTIMKECDPNNKGYLSKDDFIKLFMTKLAQKDPRDEIERAFKFFDKDNNGRITFHDLKLCAKEIGEDLHDEEIQEMMDEADINDDGTVDLEEFIKMMTKTYYFD